MKHTLALVLLVFGIVGCSKEIPSEDDQVPAVKVKKVSVTSGKVLNLVEEAALSEPEDIEVEESEIEVNKDENNIEESEDEKSDVEKKDEVSEEEKKDEVSEEEKIESEEEK